MFSETLRRFNAKECTHLKEYRSKSCTEHDQINIHHRKYLLYYKEYALENDAPFSPIPSSIRSILPRYHINFSVKGPRVLTLKCMHQHFGRDCDFLLHCRRSININDKDQRRIRIAPQFESSFKVLNDRTRGYDGEEDLLDHWRALNRLERSDYAIASLSIN